MTGVGATCMVAFFDSILFKIASVHRAEIIEILYTRIFYKPTP